MSTKGIGINQNLLNEKNGFYKEIVSLTSEIEIEALTDRLNAIMDDPTIPLLDPNRDVPWPFV